MAKAEYRSAIRSRKLINTALADLLLEKPLDKITVTDVVNRAGINRGTFYAHYANIPDVIDHVIQQTFSNIKEALSHQPKSLSEVPGTLLQCIQTLLEEDLDFYKKILNSSAAPLMQNQLMNVVLEYLIRHEEDYSIGNHEMYVLMIRFCTGGLCNLYLDWFAGRIPLTLNELTKQAEILLSRIISDTQPKKNYRQFVNSCLQSCFLLYSVFPIISSCFP